jgi:hypothetical protein
VQTWWSLGLLAALVALLQPAACATGVGAGLRVQVRIAGTVAVPDSGHVATEAQRLSGVIVADVVHSGSRWYALTLRCASAAECDAARSRLASNPDVFDRVTLDVRAITPTPPSSAPNR